MRDFRSLNVWHKAHQLALSVYHVTQAFPKEELYGLVSQMRRAAASIPMNIAEGCGHDSEAELGRFLRIAAGSVSEVEYQLLLAHDLQFLSDADYQHLTTQVTEIRKMLASLIHHLTPHHR